MKITFAYWGNYTIAFKTLFEKLGLDIIPPEKTNPEAIREGAKISPELYCFPLKVNIGNYLSAFKKGADTILMWENIGGSCRQRYYGVVQEKILRDAGFRVRVLNLNFRNLLPKIKELQGNKRMSFLQIIKAFRFAFKKIKFVEELEEKAQYFRPREEIKGKTDEILRSAFEDLDKINDEREFSRFKKEIFKKFSKIKVDKNKDIPRVGLIGEIYTVCDGAINFGIEEKLGREGIEVHREMDITYHLKKGIFPWKDWQIQRKIMSYLQSTVGGHGRDAICEMLDYVKKGFDGVIHLLPMACMPEVTVRPILEKIHQKSGIPFLSLSLDEQVAEAGINTRLEAFIDVVRNYHNKKKP
jgi:predicted nucleotide-binding protein (sugar kinase/HSP70/actin superfamily)